MKLSKDNKVKIVELFKSGMTRKEIAEEIGYKEDSVRLILYKCGINKKAETEIKVNERNKNIIEMYLKGMKQSNIVRELHCSRTTVSEVLKRNGLSNQCEVKILDNKNINPKKKEVKNMRVVNVPIVTIGGKRYKDITDLSGRQEKYMERITV